MAVLLEEVHLSIDVLSVYSAHIIKHTKNLGGGGALIMSLVMSVWEMVSLRRVFNRLSLIHIQEQLATTWKSAPSNGHLGDATGASGLLSLRYGCEVCSRVLLKTKPLNKTLLPLIK